MRNLIDSWIAAERSHGNSLAGAIKQLNETIASKVTHSRVSEWRRGVYAPSQVALSYMLYRALPWVLSQAGIEMTEEQRKAVDGRIWVLEQEGDTRYAELDWRT